MTPREAYEEDCRRWPLYNDGGARKSWDDLGALARSSWEKDPTPRDLKAPKVFPTIWSIGAVRGGHQVARVFVEKPSDLNDALETYARRIGIPRRQVWCECVKTLQEGAKNR